MNGHILGATRLINRMGSDCTIITSYQLAKAASAGVVILTLTETINLEEGHTFSIGSESVELVGVNKETNTVMLREALIGAYPIGTQLISIKTIKAMTVIRGGNLSRDNLEFIRSIRIQAGAQINFGSSVLFQDKNYFVTGLDYSDLSLRPKLTETNGIIDLAREGQGDFNGFSYDTEIKTIHTAIHGYFEHISSEVSIRNMGKEYKTYQAVSIHKSVEPRFDDIVYRNGMAMRIIGIDQSRIKNLITLYLDYDTTLQENLAGG